MHQHGYDQVCLLRLIQNVLRSAFGIIFNTGILCLGISYEDILTNVLPICCRLFVLLRDQLDDLFDSISTL